LKGIAVDPSTGNVLVTDTSIYRVKELPTNSLTKQHLNPNYEALRNLNFGSPNGIAKDHNGLLYIADSSNHMIYVVMPSGIIRNLVGTRNPGTKDGTIEEAEFNYPTSVSLDKEENNLYVVDNHQHHIRKVCIPSHLKQRWLAEDQLPKTKHRKPV